MASGYVYILINPHFDALKIGMTERTPNQRADELSKLTGVPGRYRVAYKEEVPDSRRTERLIHKKLNYARMPNGEFFDLPLDEAVRAVAEVAELVRKEAAVDAKKAAVDAKKAAVDAKKATAKKATAKKMPVVNSERMCPACGRIIPERYRGLYFTQCPHCQHCVRQQSD